MSLLSEWSERFSLAPVPKDTDAHDPTHYPESDGKPMADNMTQHRWMSLLFGNLERYYKDDPNVLVATDLLWYPERGRNDITVAPDVMVVFGRPKWERRSWLQWNENGVPAQVVFEIMSDTNTVVEMQGKVARYGACGVEELYIYDPDTGGLDAITFAPNGVPSVVAVEYEWTSPRLGVRFVPQPRADMELYFADGSPFLSNKELDALLAFRTAELNARTAELNARTTELNARTTERDARAAERDAALERAALADARAAQVEAEIAQLRALLAQSRPS